MIVYWVVPYLLVAALPIIVLLSIVLGGCTVMRTAAPAEQAQFYSDPNSRGGEELIRELERREARAELRHIIEEAQR